jgi:hypothetical protein
MQRRDVLKFLMSTAAMSAIPAELIAVVQQTMAQTSSSSGLRTLNPDQNAIVVTVSELMIPKTDTPGAKDANVNEFIDLLLSDWFDAAETEKFLQGLAQIDDACRKRFGSGFVQSNSSQQCAVLKQFDDTAIKFASAHKNLDASPEPPNFFYTFKRMTLVGYYTSEIGFKQELRKTIIPPGHAGCAPLTGEKA